MVSDKPSGSLSEATFTPQQWQRATILHLRPESGQDPLTKALHLLPVRNPDGTLNRSAVLEAVGAIASLRGLTTPQRRAAARKLAELFPAFNETPPDALRALAGEKTDAVRSQEQIAAGIEVAWGDAISRAMPLEDAALRHGHAVCERCGKDATGRIVDAYAAVFNVSAEIRDQHGHYNEIIDPTAFNRTLKNEGHRVGVYYHHAMTLHGTPSGEGSFPLGHPSVIRTDKRGVLTSTHYSPTDIGERALQLIKDGTLSAQSFSGQIRRSDPNRLRGPLAARADGTLPTVRRLELGLREYGPTPTPAYTDAQIVATRMGMGLQLPDQRAEIGLAGWAPPTPEAGESGPEDSRDEEAELAARSGRRRARLRLLAEEHFRSGH